MEPTPVVITLPKNIKKLREILLSKPCGSERVKLDVSFWRVKRLFVLAFDDSNSGKNKIERNSHQKYFLSRVDISNYKISIEGRNFYDQPINNLSKKLAKGQKD